jgi:hypothetical protein
MSALGQKQTSDCRPLMSAIPPKADMDGHSPNVRFVPIADVVRVYFDHLVRPREEIEAVSASVLAQKAERK